MKVGEYIRTLLKELKENHGVDGDFEETRHPGIGYNIRINIWTDEYRANKKSTAFILTDEFVASSDRIFIETQIRNVFNKLVEEFLS